MNVPNALTLFRILLVPAFLIAVIYGRLTTALVIFVTAGITDLLDGLFARRFGHETLLGSFLDPVADKLLMTVSFISLAITGVLPAWLAVLAVTKDLFIAIGVAVLYFSGQPVAAIPTLWGKQTTFLQIVTVALALLLAGAERWGGVLGPLFVVTAVVTAFSGLHYIISGIRSLPPEPTAEVPGKKPDNP
jgi:cardiolipin synthase